MVYILYGSSTLAGSWVVGIYGDIDAAFDDLEALEYENYCYDISYKVVATPLRLNPRYCN